MAFSVPITSSPPSTPDNNRATKSGPFAALATGPSANPFAPPLPSSAASFTPAGPPPSIVFGSSQLGSQKSLFGSPANGNANSASPPRMSNNVSSRNLKSSNKSTSPATRSAASNKTRLPSGLQQSHTFKFHVTDDDTPNNVGIGAHYSNQLGHGMEFDMAEDAMGTESKTSGAMSLNDWGQHGASTRSNKSSKYRRGAKTSRSGPERSFDSYSALYSNPVSRGRAKQSVLSTLAKSTAAQLGIADLSESSALILATEQEVRRVYPENNDLEERDELLRAALRVVPETLAKVWQRCCQEDNKDNEVLDDELDVGIGPRDLYPAYHKASFIGNLLLKLHHPPVARGKQAVPIFRSSRPGLGPSAGSDEMYREEAFPKVLLNWLDEHHNPYAEVMRNLASYQPNPTSHPNFWDLLLCLVLRGRLSEVALILKEADFRNARTATEDGFGKEGYSENALHTIDREVRRATRILYACPAVTEDDWDLQNYSWSEYRQKVDDAMKQLTETSERIGNEPVESAFDASQFNLRTSISEFTRSAKQMETKIPRSVFRSLQELYKIILGKTNELLAAAQDWVEATIALTVWWDGEDNNDGIYSLSVNQPSRLIDIDPGSAYRKRLAAAFERVTGEGDGLGDTWQIDSNRPVEIALASVFEDNVEGTISLLEAFSLPIASAVIEIASQGGWYRPPPAEEKAGELDDNDLMVLSYGQPEKPLTKNDLLHTYADRLFEIKLLEWPHAEPKEGWELAIEILSRIDNVQMADAKISELISCIEVQSDQRADKVIRLCRMFELDTEACKVSEKYADTVTGTSDRFGTALVYYARAHSDQKVKKVLGVLISYCLVQSIAYPPLEELDPHLSSLLRNPRESLVWLANLDPRAAEILSINMSGYATLRRFYEIRDQAGEGNKLSFAQKKSAAAALLTVISSASSSIQGGIYDAGSDAVVPFDVLFVLLGEAMPFVDTRVRYLSLRQIMVLLRAIEDVQTVDRRIRVQCEACLRSTLIHAYGASAQLSDRQPQPQLQKSISALTGSSGFSLVGVSMESSGSLPQRNEKDKGRGWDWREGLKPEDGGDEIVGMLRLGLAREVARAWLEGEEL